VDTVVVRNIENIKQYRQGRMITLFCEKNKLLSCCKVLRRSERQFGDIFYQYALMVNPLPVFSNWHSYELYIWGVGGLCHVCQRQITLEGSVAQAM